MKHGKISSKIAASRSLLVATTILAAGVPTVALAQNAPPTGALPVRQSVDGNGVDLFFGKMNYDGPTLSAGDDAMGIAYRQIFRSDASGDSLWASLYVQSTTTIVNFDGHADRFTKSGTTYLPTEANGASLTLSGTVYTYQARDGSIIHFNTATEGPYPYRTAVGLVTDITRPSGASYVYTYDKLDYCGKFKDLANGGFACLQRTSSYRASSVTSKGGYRINFVYDPIDQQDESQGELPNLATWGRQVQVKVSNTLQPEAGTRTLQFGQYSASGYNYLSTTDPVGRVSAFRYSPTGMGIRRAGSPAEDITVAYDSSSRVFSLTSPSGTTTYTYADSAGLRTTTVTDPLGHQSVYVFTIASQRMKSMTDPLLRTTQWEYDASGRLTKTISPEQNYTRLTYDARGNVTETRQVAKPGAGLADIVTTAGFDASCAAAAKCNQPNWTRDANGNQTDYSYNSSTGTLSSVAAPAATTGGIRPTTSYGYGTVNSTQVLTSISRCQANATCAGTADEVKTTIGYNTNGLPSSVASGAGDSSLTSTIANGYNAFGDKVSVDGPLAGTADTTTYRYNADRELIGVVSADPDGAGALLPRAQRLTRDDAGRVTLIENGNVTSSSDVAWSVFSGQQQLAVTFDAAGHRTQDTLTAGGAIYQLTQYSYDADGRLECTAQRMNSATWSALPGACSLATTGAAGPDRITRNYYDAANQVTKVQTAYGTAEQADEAIGTYTGNGAVASLTDAEGNKTSYEYDGFDRLSVTRYPVATAGAAASSSSDYEQFGYDAASNVASRRLRDGQSITYGYDNLNRLVGKVTPGTAYLDWDTSYTYDLLGRLKSAVGDGWAGNSFVYDALGRLTNEQYYNASTASFYDLAGRRTRLVWSDGFYVDYDYNVTGEMTAIRENSATSGVGVLATYSYDNLGRRAGIVRGNGTSTSYGYDAASRLSSLSQDLAGTANDFTNGFTYNPAGQISSQTRSNDAYAWNGHYNVDRPYTVNGLNEVTAAGGIALGFDGRGNLNSSQGNIYNYTAENRLATTTGVTMVYEPAAGQILQYATNASGDVRFAWAGDQMMAEYNTTNAAMLRRYVPGPGTDEPVVWYEGASTSDRRWLHADERGSVVAVTDASGNVLRINRYDEYGIPASTNIGRFQYTGQAWLPELGMYYYKARIYSPGLGRFMQTDPIGYVDGMNWYNYVGSDPVNFSDPTGLAGDCSDAAKSEGDPDCDVVVNGKKNAKALAWPFGGVGGTLGSIIAGGSASGSGSGGSKTKSKPKNKPKDCWKGLDPTKTGQVTFTASTSAGALILGYSATRGTFRTESGISGTFTTSEFLAGIRGEFAQITGFSRNLSTFMGGNDTFAQGFLFDDTSGSNDLDGNFVGASSSVAGTGIALGISTGLSNTDVEITGCPAK